MAKLTTILRRVPAMTCIAALVSGHAFASDPNEYTLAPAAPQAVTVEQVAPAYVAPAPTYVEPEVTVYNPPVTDIYVEPAPAPEQYVDRCQDGITTNNEGCDPCDDDDINNDEANGCGAVYVIQETAPAPVEPVQAVQPAPAAPAPQPVVYNPPPAAPAPTVVAAPTAPVGGLGSSGLGNAGLIAAGVGAAALIGIAAIALSDDDDDAVSTTTTTTN